MYTNSVNTLMQRNLRRRCKFDFYHNKQFGMNNIIYIFKLHLYRSPVFNYKLNFVMINLWKFLPWAKPSAAKGRVITSFLCNKNGLNFT